MYVLGLLGMPRRVYTYAPDLGWNTLNLVSSIGGYMIAVVVPALLRQRRAQRPLAARSRATTPGDAWTLEWATTSPPPHGNFARLPVVHSEQPLWDVEHGYEEQGRLEKVEFYDVPPEPEQRTITPFWVAFGILVMAVGLLEHAARSASSARSSSSSRSPCG